MLVVLRYFHALSHFVGHVKNLVKVSWSVQGHVFDCSLVSLKDSIKAITFWIANITIESKAMTWSSIVRVEMEVGPESEGWELFVRIIELKNISNRFERLVVLVV